MPISSTDIQPSCRVLAEPKLSDIAPIFNLIQAGSLGGHFSNLYTQPRYMAGLGIQLFSLWKRNMIRLPDRTWHRASMKTLRIGNDFAGFIILRHEASRPNAVEIYMCGVVNRFRGQGLGEWMLRTALADVPLDYSLYADCLPDSIQMKSLLKKLGFHEDRLSLPTQIPQGSDRLVRRLLPDIPKLL